jgi:CRISPR-associated protein Csb1
MTSAEQISELRNQTRLLLEASLRPVAGTRFQPTGFPDLGPAVYQAPDGTDMLLVESAQSMANRLEAVCWDEAKEDLVPELQGLPYVRVKVQLGDHPTSTTCSLLEFHRLNSPYIMSGVLSNRTSFKEVLTKELGLPLTSAGKKKRQAAAATSDDEAAADDTEEAEVAGCVNLRRLAEVCFKYDPNSLIHGVFLEKIAGRLRHPRALSAFIEARGARPADSGGVKFDRILPKPSVAGLGAEAGYGNVPFHRREFTAEAITAYFTLDLAQLRGYGLGDPATDLLIALSLWKIRRFLETGLRLRTACDLELVGEPVVKQPTGFQLPTTAALTATLKQLIQACQEKFAKPPVTKLTWTAEAKKSGKKAGAEKSAD